MTWFEVEQMDKYLDWLETQLEEWRLERIQMQIENAELMRTIRKAEVASNNDISNPILRDHLIELRRRSCQCRRQIEERLKHR